MIDRMIDRYASDRHAHRAAFPSKSYSVIRSGFSDNNKILFKTAERNAGTRGVVLTLEQNFWIRQEIQVRDLNNFSAGHFLGRTRLFRAAGRSGLAVSRARSAKIFLILKQFREFGEIRAILRLKHRRMIQ